MSITVRIPALWQPITNEGQLTVQACTLADALNELVARFPRLHSHIFNPSNGVNEAIHLFVNGEAIRFRGGLAAPLRDGDELYIVMMISGG